MQSTIIATATKTMRASSSRSNLAWAQVRKTGPGKNGAYPLTCNHCNLAFKGNLSRVLTHLTGRGSGVRVCSSVPEDMLVQLNAETAAVDAAKASNKRNREIEDDLLVGPMQLNNAPVPPQRFRLSAATEKSR